MENFSFFFPVFGSIKKKVKRKLSYLVWHEMELLSTKFSRKQFLFYLKLNKESKKIVIQLILNLLPNIRK